MSDVSDAIAVTSRIQKCPIYEVLPSPSRDLCGTEKLYQVGSKLRKHNSTGGQWMPKVGDSTSVKMAFDFLLVQWLKYCEVAFHPVVT